MDIEGWGNNGCFEWVGRLGVDDICCLLALLWDGRMSFTFILFIFYEYYHIISNQDSVNIIFMVEKLKKGILRIFKMPKNFVLSLWHC